MKHLTVGISQNDGLRLVVVSIDTTEHICSGCTVPTRSCVEHEQVVLWTAVKRLLWDHCDTRLSRNNRQKMFSEISLGDMTITASPFVSVRTQNTTFPLDQFIVFSGFHVKQKKKTGVIF